jgi:hypothetical protein
MTDNLTQYNISTIPEKTDFQNSSDLHHNLQFENCAASTVTLDDGIILFRESLT